MGLQNSKFLVNVLYTFQDLQNLYFVMQYMPNGSLSELLEAEGRFELNVVQYFAAQVLLCIEFLHRHLLIHRDIKPENVLLDQNMTAKLADFGLSEELQNQKNLKT